MRAGEARSLARHWLYDHVAPLAGLRGALWHGSVLELPEDAPLDLGSDIDLIAVFDAPPPTLRQGKHPIDGVLIDLTVLPWETVRDPETVLGNHQLAPSFRSPELLADRDGVLSQLCDVVGREFARRVWVQRRSDRAIGKVLEFLGSIDPSAPFAHCVMSWIFGTGVTTHVLLVAGLRNPTVRKRYAAVRELLSETGMPEVHEELLHMLGSYEMTSERVSHHLDTLAPAFDAASRATRTQLFFASDLTPAARPIAIDGSREMIAAGSHREAMFWVAVTWTRCMQVLANDAPALETQFEPAFQAMLADLGIHSLEDMRRHASEVESSLPHLRKIATTIMDRTPAIQG